MENDYYFSAYERMLLARYHKDIKLHCWTSYKTLSAVEKASITRYRAIFNNPAKYSATKHSKVLLPENVLIRMCNIDKIRSFFKDTAADRAKRECYRRKIKISYDSLKKFMNSVAEITELNDKDVKWLQLASLVTDEFTLVFGDTAITLDTKEDK